MNKQQALAWLVENVTKWPVDISDIDTGISVDFWHSLDDDNCSDIVFCDYLDIGSVDKQITQQDWLGATDTL